MRGPRLLLISPGFQNVELTSPVYLNLKVSVNNNIIAQLKGLVKGIYILSLQVYDQIKAGRDDILPLKQKSRFRFPVE